MTLLLHTSCKRAHIWHCLHPQATYAFALEHLLLLCKENSTKKSYRFKLRAALPTKGLTMERESCFGLLLCFVRMCMCMRVCVRVPVGKGEACEP